MTHRLSRFSALAMAGLLVLAAVPVASASEHSRVRVLHGSPDAPAVDVHVDGTAVLTGVAFGTISDYLSVPAGDHQVQVFAAGTTTDPVIDETLDLAVGASYTVAATNAVASIEARVMVDDPAPTTGAAQVRAVHLSADAPAVDVAPRGSDTAGAVITNLAYPDATEYLSLDAGSYDLDVRATGTTTVALELPTLDIAAGTAYSVFVIGSAADPAVGDNALEAVVTVDATADGPTPPPTDTATPGATRTGAPDFALVLIAILALVAGMHAASRSAARRVRADD